MCVIIFLSFGLGWWLWTTKTTTKVSARRGLVQRVKSGGLARPTLVAAWPVAPEDRPPSIATYHLRRRSHGSWPHRPATFLIPRSVAGFVHKWSGGVGFAAGFSAPARPSWPLFP